MKHIYRGIVKRVLTQHTGILPYKQYDGITYVGFTTCFDSYSSNLY